MAQYRDGRNTRPIYFYCVVGSAESGRSQPEVILRTLVRQQMSCLGATPVLDQTWQDYDARSKGDSPKGSLTIEECAEVIISITQHRPLTTIVIDALDEVQQRERYQLLEALSTIVSDSPGLVKILVSSRNDQDIVGYLNDVPNIEIRSSQNQDDITKYVNSELDSRIKSKRLLHGKVDADLKIQIKETLCEKAQGMLV